MCMHSCLELVVLSDEIIDSFFTYFKGVSIDDDTLALALKMTAIEDVWGIGRRLSPFFKQRGINTALDFKTASPSMIQRRVGINGTRTRKELSGNPATPWKQVPSGESRCIRLL
ncbi:hypothetical protein [Desulfocicer niacini]